MNYVKIKDTNCYGDPAEKMLSRLFNSAELCQEACNLWPECQSAIFVNKYTNNEDATDKPRCWLKTKLKTCAYQKGQDSYVKPKHMLQSSYVRGDNPAKGKFWGCQIQGTDPRSSSADPRSVEALCTENAACTGYNGDDGGPWFIATDTDPTQCKKPSQVIYKDFYKKTWG